MAGKAERNLVFARASFWGGHAGKSLEILRGRAAAQIY